MGVKPPSDNPSVRVALEGSRRGRDGEHEAGAAQNGPPLAGKERYGRIYTTLSTNGLSLGTCSLACALSFTPLTMLGIIDEVLTLEEALLLGCEGKFFTTRDTVQFSVYKGIRQNAPG